MACVGVELYVAQTVCLSSCLSLLGAGITGVCVSTCSTLLTGENNEKQKLKMFSQNLTAEKQKKKGWRTWLSGKDPLNFSVS